MFFQKEIGLDLGTSTVLVYVEDKGIVVSEPSLVAYDSSTDKIVRFGTEARAMLGRTPENIQVMRPLKDGVISRYDMTLRMMQYFLHKACGNMLFQPGVTICIPSGIKDSELHLLREAAKEAGANRIHFLEEPLAAAIGAGIDVTAPSGHMIVDIGGGTTDVAVVSMRGVVVAQSIRIAGDKFDEAIVQYVRRKHNVLIGDQTAETIKIRIGAVYDHKVARELEVRGRCLLQGVPKSVTVSSKEILEALMDPITAIIDTICTVVEKIPPALVGDVLQNGITMTGGASQIYGFDKLIEDVTGIKTRVAKDPVSCVAVGTGRAQEIGDLPETPSGLFTPGRTE
jgi:rod shape-determining protein MreB